ncbi:hypothetical protein PALB_36230 [Pseudoalteromonas luteoviolacea B = ATCC 29581]|nr:hypothetical protein PALB_36230 [Pseudoalteromonas luteoviolacea B = ATCC 29581]
MKVGHRQALIKRKPDSKESGFFALCVLESLTPIQTRPKPRAV